LYDHLRDNADIQPGDAILIHYSGHGTTYDVHEIFDNTFDSIEAICPVDRGVEDPYQGTVLDISDREINLFLTELSNIKGDNITLVLDCSFSATVPNPNPTMLLSRGTPPLVSPLRQMLLAAENNPRKRWAPGSAITTGWKPDVSSYVVLAACQGIESAWECSDGRGGDFTIAFLKALRALPLHTLTYRHLIGHIGSLRRQKPCAVGNHVDQFIFNHWLGPHYIGVSRKAERSLPDVGHRDGKFVRIFHWLLTWLGW
jgi:hypothetical protein